MKRRFAKTLVLGGVTAGIACIDMSAPKGAASISSLLLPSPSVVVGDTMRDSLGAPAPLSIVAYDVNGARINVDAQFFVTDTSNAIAHLNAGNILVGDKLGIVHVVGQIGSLQTSVVTVPITVAPTTFSAVTTTIDTLRPPTTGDSATSIGGAALQTRLRGASDSAAQGFLVKYALTYAPATATGKSPAVYLANDLGKPSTVDTSDVTGASRRLTVNARFLADPAVAAGTKIDSAVVTASAFYKGIAVSGSPIKFVVPIRVEIPK